MTYATDIREPAAAFAAATLVVACVALASRGAPLPASGWAAAFLLLAVHQDLTRMRIPNWLTLPGLLLALCLGGLAGGLEGLLHAACGAAVALAILLPPFAFRAIGAGDVKACMVLGALWGPAVFLPAFGWMIAAGGLLALALLAIRGELGALLVRWARSATATVLTRRITYFGPAHGAATGLPFAVCMALGAAAYAAWGNPWS